MLEKDTVVSLGTAVRPDDCITILTTFTVVRKGDVGKEMITKEAFTRCNPQYLSDIPYPPPGDPLGWEWWPHY